MTLAALIQSDVADVCLQTDDFAELVTYYPIGGEARQITAVVARQQAPLEKGQVHDTRNEMLVLHCAESDTTGIKGPQLRDTIVLAGEDPATQKWSYQETVSREGGMIALRYQRKKLDRHGGKTPNDL